MTTSSPKFRDPTIEEELNPTVLTRIVEDLSARDATFLATLHERGKVLIETVVALIPCENLVWMIHFGVVATDVTRDDKLFLELSDDGQQVLDAYRNARRVRAAPR